MNEGEDQLTEQLLRHRLAAGRQAQQHREQAPHDAVEARRRGLVLDILVRRRVLGVCTWCVPCEN